MAENNIKKVSNTSPSLGNDTMKDLQDDDSGNWSLPMRSSSSQYTAGDRFMELILKEPHQVIALSLGLIAITANVLSILAIWKIRRNRLTAHYRFILSLAVSDIVIGLSILMMMVNTVVNPTYWPGARGIPWSLKIQSYCIYMLIKALNTMALNFTLFNLMGMAIDHYLAIMKPLHYPTLMSNTRANIMIGIFWAMAAISGFSDFFTGYPKYPRNKHRYNYCEFIYITRYSEEFTTFAIAAFCMLVMSFIYIRLSVKVCQRVPVRMAARGDLQRNKKAVLTTLLILSTFILCWLPNCLFQVSMIILSFVDKEKVRESREAYLNADQYLMDLMFLNCILDPTIYAIRMREVQVGYQRLFWRCCRHFYKDRANNGDSSTHCTVLLDERKSSRYSMGSIRNSDRVPINILSSKKQDSCGMSQNVSVRVGNCNNSNNPESYV